MMKYKIKIWQYRRITDTYESDSIEDALEWYRANWQWPYECGGCAFDVYKDGKLLSFDEELELGFLD